MAKQEQIGEGVPEKKEKTREERIEYGKNLVKPVIGDGPYSSKVEHLEAVIKRLKEEREELESGREPGIERIETMELHLDIYESLLEEEKEKTE